MGQRIFLSLFGAVFVLLLVVQGYFALNDGAVKEMRAERLGAEFVDRGVLTAEAGDDIGGMTVYVTFETAENRPSQGIVTVNGIESGTLEKGILTLALKEGDIIAVRNAVGEDVFIADYPDGLDADGLPSSLFCDEIVTKWGKISFK